MGSQRNRVVTTTLFAAFVVIMLLVTTVRPTPPVDLAVYLRAARMFATGGGLHHTHRERLLVRSARHRAGRRLSRRRRSRSPAAAAWGPRRLRDRAETHPRAIRRLLARHEALATGARGGRHLARLVARRGGRPP